jgi:hypothetical protein
MYHVCMYVCIRIQNYRLAKKIKERNITGKVLVGVKVQLVVFIGMTAV